MRQYFTALACISIILFNPASSASTSEAILDYSARSRPVYSQTGIVVSQEAIASQVGADILSKGGNAIDAAVATGFALAVTLPQAGNLGGGGFMLAYLKEIDKTIAVDYREIAPALAKETLFQDESGNVLKQKARFSHASAGVPGTVAGLLYVQENFGTLSLKEILKPAIKLAEKGFTVSNSLAFSLNRRAKSLKQDPSSARYFFKEDGRSLQAGDLWIQKDLAKTLKRIAKHGKAGFYEGKTAALIVNEMKENNGLISLKDLKNYQVIERQPVFGMYKGYQVASMPPPSSGGIHLIQMLNMIETNTINSDSHNSAEYIHLLVNAMKRAYADRSQYLGDPDYVAVPQKELIDKQYAKHLASMFTVKATPSSDIHPGLAPAPESPDTTHYSVWDSQGNVVSNTYTLNFSFGSGKSVNGAGFLLNNEMDDFSAKPGSPNAYGLIGGVANAIEPGKRPLSSMTPTIVFKDGKPVIATGSPGGSTIITIVLQTLVNIIDFEMNASEATQAPRIHHQWLPDVIAVEKGISKDTKKLLKNKGYVLRESRAMGRVQTILYNNGVLEAASDQRWPDGAAIASEQ